MKAKSFYVLFYIFLASLLFYSSNIFEDSFKGFSGPVDFIWLAHIIYSVIPFSPWHIRVLFLTTFLFSIICLFADNKILKGLTCFFLILLFSIKYSLGGKINHNFHIWLFSAFFMVFYKTESGFKCAGNKLVVRLVQSTLLLQYFSSGLWKFIELENKLSFSYLKEVIFEHVAYSVAEGSSRNMFLVETLIHQYSNLLAFGFLLVLIFELSCIVPVLTGQYFYFFGFCIILFHAMTNEVMGVFFPGNVVAAFFFLVYVEGVLMKDQNDPPETNQDLTG